MNIYELHEPDSWVPGLSRKKESFFLFSTVKRALLCSLFYMMFINSDMRNKTGAQGTNSMNIMQIYEQGIYKGAFVKSLLFNERRETVNFIDVHKFTNTVMAVFRKVGV